MGLALFRSSQSQVVFSTLRVLGFFSSVSSSTLASSSTSSSVFFSTGSASSSIGSSTSSVYHIKAIWCNSHTFIRLVCLKYLASPQVNIKVDELRISVNQVTNSVHFKEITSLFLQIKRNLGTTEECITARIFNNAKRVGIWLPNVLLVIVALRSNNNAIGNCQNKEN